MSPRRQYFKDWDGPARRRSRSPSRSAIRAWKRMRPAARRAHSYVAVENRRSSGRRAGDRLSSPAHSAEATGGLSQDDSGAPTSWRTVPGARRRRRCRTRRGCGRSSLGIACAGTFASWARSQQFRPGGDRRERLRVPALRAGGHLLGLYEAMSAGVPEFVGADVGGHRELVTPECGVLIRRARGTRGRGVRRALAELLRNPERRKAMGKAARARVHAHFGLERWATGWRRSWNVRESSPRRILVRCRPTKLAGRRARASEPSCSTTRCRPRG